MWKTACGLDKILKIISDSCKLFFSNIETNKRKYLRKHFVYSKGFSIQGINSNKQDLAQSSNMKNLSHHQ